MLAVNSCLSVPPAEEEENTRTQYPEGSSLTPRLSLTCCMLAQHTRLAPYPNEFRLTRCTQPSLAPALTHISARSARISAHRKPSRCISPHSVYPASRLRLAGRRIHIAAYQPLHGFSVAAFCRRSLSRTSQPELIPHLSQRMSSHGYSRAAPPSEQPKGRGGRDTRHRCRRISPRTDPCPAASQPRLKRCAYFLSGGRPCCTLRWST